MSMKPNALAPMSPVPERARCCECISQHLEFDELPACVFPHEVEKTYDRSFYRFVEVFNARSGRKG